jgi:hypothetical protein
MNLDRDQIHHYFETRLGVSLSNREKIAVKCCFHDDGTASATVFLSGNGGFNCQSCQAKGNTYQFEQKFSKCDLETAKRNIAEITGAELDRAGGKGLCTGVYDYRLANGSIAFQKRRYQPTNAKKTFSIVRPNDDGGWTSGLEGMPESSKVLYNLPDVVVSNLILLCEGEKDCGTLDELNLFPDKPDIRVASTTNFEGAWQPGHSPKWSPRYNPYFTGKRVVIFEDNDESGRTWAAHIAAEIYPFAESVRRIGFTEMPEKSDVTDWMATHTAPELRKLILTSPTWKPTAETDETKRVVFVSAPIFAHGTSEEIEWMVHGVVQRHANGFICAEPKVGKSWAALDMLISVAIGCPWLEFEIPAPIRCGLVSREDNPALTAWRMKKLYASKNCDDPTRLERNLYINSRQQTAQFFLDNDDDIAEMITDIKRLGLEFVILDVLNVLHGSDENDNSEMTKIMARIRKIQAESKASLGIVHHYNKAGEGSITKRLRGASAIAGFAEWLIGIGNMGDELKTRRMEFETKADQPPDPIYFRIQTNTETGKSSLDRVEYNEKTNNTKKV